MLFLEDFAHATNNLERQLRAPSIFSNSDIGSSYTRRPAASNACLVFVRPVCMKISSPAEMPFAPKRYSACVTMSRNPELEKCWTISSDTVIRSLPAIGTFRW
jgi:hypothetical protein